jgi:hypothetical protein
MYEAQSGGNVELMLQRTPTNSRENEQLARFNAVLSAMTDNWTGPYKNLWGDLPAKLQEHYLVMDAFSRKQAIELAGVVAKAEAVQAGPDGQMTKRGGLLGLLGIK